MTGTAVIRRAASADLDAVLALERAGFDEAARWSAESWRAELAGDDRCMLVAAGRPEPASPPRSRPDRPDAAAPKPTRPALPDDGGLLGAATFQLIAGVADLHRVVVAPGHRGRGIGRALLEAGIAWASDRHGERMLLEVEHDNAAALGLYRRLGFADLARRDDYYGPGRHALVLQRDLAGAGRLAASDIAGTVENADGELIA